MRVLRNWLGLTRYSSVACMSKKVKLRTSRNGRGLSVKTTVLGGPSVSASPDRYPEFDYLHIGEIGDATDALIRALDQDVRPPPTQRRFVTEQRLSLAEFPLPAFELIDGRRYFLGSIQFSSGCPYRCEFCDIPALYGRVPRLKTPDQVVAELDALIAAGIQGSIYFVDDNFIANKKAARELLPHLVAWQKRRGYPLQLSCEATLNIAKCPDILALMRDAYFCTVFCGIETPELEALSAMGKSHNQAMPILDAVATLNSYGIEVVSGIILGLDTDTPATAARLTEFIDRSRIPVLTINLLQALPKTPLWDRLAATGRLTDDPRRDFERRLHPPLRRSPGELVPIDPLRLRAGGDLSAICVECPPYSSKPPAPANYSGARHPRNLRRGAVTLGKLSWRIGVLGDHRRTFWQMALPALRAGRIEELIQVALVAHHMIVFARECATGRQSAAFYADRGTAPRTLTSLAS